jgi:flagellar hook-length control protein FliK
MPTLFTSAGATPSLSIALTPVAANPIAPIGEGGEGGFSAVISGLTPNGMMLEAPPALPHSGTALPPERPDVAASPTPLELDVEQVMVGSVLPRPIVANMPAAEVPASQVPTLPVPLINTRLPAPAAQQPVAPEVIDAPAPGAKPALPEPEAPVRPAQVAPDRTRIVFRNMPATAEPTAPEAPAPATAAVRPVEPAQVETKTAETAPADPTQADLVPGDMMAIPQLELVPSVVQPIPTSVEPTPRPIVAEATEGEVPVPVIVLPMSGRTAAVPTTPSISAKPKAGVERPLEPAPIEGRDDPLPNLSAKPVPAAAPRPDLVIPPELARQVAQIVRPMAQLTDAPVVDIPATDFAPLTPVVASQPAPAPPVTFQPAQPAAQVDTARAEWMQAMIDRIGDAVQEGGKREALIRLLPDALGAVEVRIVERDDRLQVTLNADTAQARQLLSEHAPRLAEMAEARGLRFAQTDIGGGHAQQQDRRPAPEHPTTPLRPRSAQAEPDASTDDGERIA